ncbi:MAG: metallophosphoesterase [Deltaproteobacteria bacterium]|nr:metallophosphoesterase [Deltaproteobacteria bacterium]
MTEPIILHAADLHLGGPVAAPDPAQAGLAARARAQALEALVALTRRVGARVVLLAGDVFHSPTPPLAAVALLERALAAWAASGVRVFLAPGNHDPFTPDAVWASLPLPAGVTVFPPEGGGVDLPEEGLWVAGAAHAAPRVTQDLSPCLPPPPEGRRGVAVLHAALAGAAGSGAHEPYAPARLADLAAGPFSYWALGHVHRPQVLGRGPLVAYAGALQAAHPGEPGLRGARVARWDGAAWQDEFHSLAPLCFWSLTLADLAQVTSPGELVGRVAAGLPAGAGAGAGAGWCLRLTLAGPSPLAGRPGLGPALAETLRQELGLGGLGLDISRLRPPGDPAALAREPHVLGRFLALAREAAADPAILAELARELETRLHPLHRGLDPADRAERLAGLLDQAAHLGLRDLWQGGEGPDEA